MRCHFVLVCTSNQGKIFEFQTYFEDEPVFGFQNLLDSSDLIKRKYREPIENSDSFLSNAFCKIYTCIELLKSSKKFDFLKDSDKIIADDSGLCVPALNYLPGVHSAIYAGCPRNDEKNNQKLMSEIDKTASVKIHQNEKRLDAFFVCFLIVFSLKDIKDFNLLSEKETISAQTFFNEKIAKIEKEILRKIDFSKIGGGFLNSLSLDYFHTDFPSIEINIGSGFCIGEVSTKYQRIAKSGHGYDPIFYGKENPNQSFASISIEQKNKISHRALAMQQIEKILNC